LPCRSDKPDALGEEFQVEDDPAVLQVGNARFEGDQGFAAIRLLDLQQVASAEIPSPTPAGGDPLQTFENAADWITPGDRSSGVSKSQWGGISWRIYGLFTRCL
jgi:hypothetical protein